MDIKIQQEEPPSRIYRKYVHPFVPSHCGSKCYNLMQKTLNSSFAGFFTYCD